MALIFAAALVPLVGLAVSAQAETLALGAPATMAAETSALVKTHTNAGFAGANAAPFSVECLGCHSMHKAPAANLLPADGAALCTSCHALDPIHSDPATQQSVDASAAPADCVTCHPHSSGFMPVAGGVSLTLSNQTTGYDDLDGDGNLSPGDRVHYRIEYANPGPDGVTGAVLRDEPDTAHVASVEAISDGGTLDGTAIQWNIGTLAGGVSGFVTYDVVLQDATAFGGSGTTTTTTPPSTDSSTTTSTDSSTTTASIDSSTTTASIDSTTTTAPAPDSSTTTTAATESTTTTMSPPTTPAGGSTDVVNTALLTADGRGPVSSSVTVSVVVASPVSLTSSTPSTTESTTTTPLTTEAPSTTTTSAPGATEVINTVVLSADNRDPVSTAAVVSVAAAGSPSTTSTTTITSTTDSATTVSGLVPLNLIKRALGYDDLDGDGNLSPGDRVHYRIDYGNPGPEDVTGAVLLDQLDATHVASVEALTDGGTLDKTACGIQWDLGTLVAGTSGYVTYDVVLRDAVAFGSTTSPYVALIAGNPVVTIGYGA